MPHPKRCGILFFRLLEFTHFLNEKAHFILINKGEVYFAKCILWFYIYERLSVASSPVLTILDREERF